MTALKNETNYNLHIPINSIDLRVSHLSFKLQSSSTGQAPTFALKELLFNNTKTNVVSDFTNIYKYKLLSQKHVDDDEDADKKININSLNEIDISTEDFFYYDSFETNSTVEGYFTISGSIALKAGKDKDDVKLIFELQDATKETTSNSKSKLKALPVSITSDPKILNLILNPQVSFSSGKIFLKKGLCSQEQKLPPFHIKFTFENENGAFSANDIQINRIVRSQGTITSVDLSKHLQINKTDQTNTTAIFEDQNKTNASVAIKCGNSLFFEIIYEMILLNDNAQIEVSLEKFEVSLPTSETNSPSFVGPIIGTVDPKYIDLSSIGCPYLFEKVNQGNK